MNVVVKVTQMITALRTVRKIVSQASNFYLIRIIEKSPSGP